MSKPWDKNEKPKVSVLFPVRLTPEMKAHIDAEAEARQITKSAVVRSILLQFFENEPLPVRKSKKAIAIESEVLELVRIGTNVNQMARKLNIMSINWGNMDGAEDRLKQVEKVLSKLEKVLERLTK